MEEVERLEKEIGEGAPDVERKRGEMDQFLFMLDSEVTDSKASLTVLQQHRAELVLRIPREMLSTYERMSRTKRGQALAAIRDGICSACRVRVRPKVFSDVRRGDQMITCESCGRILYYRPNTPQSAEASTN